MFEERIVRMATMPEISPIFKCLTTRSERDIKILIIWLFTILARLKEIINVTSQ